MPRGRKSRAEELGRQEKLDEVSLPALGDTEESVKAYVAAVTELLVAALISAATAKELNNAASITLRAIKQKNAGAELERWEKLMADDERAEKRFAEKMATARQRRGKNSKSKTGKK